ncbi:MAG: hypothetical protein HKM07_02240 [Chlamydiae bacterium]|nr:hypothetical protein [Chlamydiota bacterium]
MLLSEFGLDIISGWLSNKFGKIIDKRILKLKKYKDCKNMRKPFFENLALEVKTKLFQTFDVYIDLEKILPRIANPIAHILIEKEAIDSFWNQACLVLESKVTGEWYVFRRGRMAMQGVGGGIRQSEIALKRLKESKAYIAVWAISTAILDEFENGGKLWPEVKISAIPFFSSIGNNDGEWCLIQDRTRELLSANY